MKNVIIIILILISLANIYAKDGMIGKSNNAFIGFNIDKIQDEFGYGLNFGSPHFLNNKFSLKFSTILTYYKLHEEDEWEHFVYYWSYKCSINYNCSDFEDKRLFVESGCFALAHNKKISDKTVFGAYGLLGFEFFLNLKRNNSIFIEVGCVGTGAKAEKVLNKPIFSEGFSISSGYRYYF